MISVKNDVIYSQYRYHRFWKYERNVDLLQLSRVNYTGIKSILGTQNILSLSESLSSYLNISDFSIFSLLIYGFGLMISHFDHFCIMRGILYFKMLAQGCNRAILVSSALKVLSEIKCRFHK